MLRKYHVVLTTMVLLFAIVVTSDILWYNANKVSYLDKDRLELTYSQVNAYQIVFNKSFDKKSKDLKQLNQEIESIKDLLLSIGIARNVEIYEMFEYRQTVALVNIAIANLKSNHDHILKLSKKDYLKRVKKDYTALSSVPYESFIAQVESPTADIVLKLNKLGLSNLQATQQLRMLKDTLQKVYYSTVVLVASLTLYLSYIYLAVFRRRNKVKAITAS